MWIFSILGFLGVFFRFPVAAERTGPHGHGLETITTASWGCLGSWDSAQACVEGGVVPRRLTAGVYPFRLLGYLSTDGKTQSATL